MASRALVIAAPASGSGKTIVTLSILRALAETGLDVVPAKIGPDYIDPRFHEAACGRPSVNLDGWAMRPERLDHLATPKGDLMVVEGVMGLFDGAPDRGAVTDGSTAAIATRYGWPVVLVIDAARQAQSVAALVQGFRDHRADVMVAGVILNRVGSTRHAATLRRAIEPLGLAVIGALPRDDGLALPSRHLGLVQAGETEALDVVMARGSALVREHLDLDALTALADAAATTRTPPLAAPAFPPFGQRIAVAHDVAFTFTYPHVLDGWRAAGVEILPFSPLDDEALDPAANAVFLPGGYPELHAGRLAANTRFLRGLRHAAGRGVAIYGECGGYMVLGEGLIDVDGTRHAMAGLLPVTTSFAVRRLHLGYRTATTRVDTPLGPKGATFRGHEFHYASVTATGGGPALFDATDANGEGIGPVGHAVGPVFGSFMHLIDHG